MPTLYCPTCGYNLTGLSEHRCPECGAGFDPAELTRRRDEDDAGVVKSAIAVLILFPILWAVVAIIIMVPMSLLISFTPVYISIICGVATVLGVLVPPILHGCYFAKCYSRARITYRTGEGMDVVPRPAWMFCLLFSACECVLMIAYIFPVSFVIVSLFAL